MAVDVGRPTRVGHVLVEPESTGNAPYRKTPIATFEAQEPFRLTQEAIAEFSAQLAEYVRHDDIELYRGGHGRKQKYIDKYLYFIKDWLLDNPHGRRLLAFIGSKSDQVKLADRLQAQINKAHSLQMRRYNDERLHPVFEEARNDDTSISIDVLRRALGKGVFIHNADINRTLRFAMEDYLSRALPHGAASEVVIATETLSYGVNLSIDDVALLSLEFPASERNQEYGATPKLLSRCAFSNMCGRAGRLNHLGREPTVYVWPITDHESSPRRLVEIFYNEDEFVRSKIMHGDDKEANDKIRSGKRNAEFAPMLFTYPFVKTFLDGLRFTDGAPGLNGATRRNDASFEELEDEFTDHLLYSQENRDNVGQLYRLNESVQMVLTASMHANLELVKRSGRGYKITHLGLSIIDTGTEISTLETLKKALGTLLRHLRAGGAPDELPVEILLFAIVVQNEAHRQVIFGMPEFRTEVSREENREELFRWVHDAFSRWGFTAAVCSAMRLFLQDCDGDPRHAPSGETGTELVHDACLRLFCGLLLWVSGQPIAAIHNKLKTIGKITGSQVEINTNFATFADRISWKLMFLGDLMRLTANQTDIRMLQTRSRRLNTRLRLGCAENALPFLAKDGNRTSPISRKIAHDILDAGGTPKTISSGDFDLDGYSITLGGQIRTQVRRYIRASLHQLKNEFVYNASSEGADSVARSYWEFADTVIRKFTDNDPEMPSWPGTESDESVQAAPGRFDEESPKVRLQEKEGALVLVGHRLRWDDDTKKPVDAVRWHVQASYGGTITQPSMPGYTSVIVDFPWLLRATPNQTGVLRMSPAAFGILLTLITRSFFRDAVDVLETLSAREGSISSLTLIERVYSELTFGQLPEALFDAWAGYWDAE